MFKKIFGKDSKDEPKNLNENSITNLNKIEDNSNPMSTFNYTPEAQREIEEQMEAFKDSNIEISEDLDILFAQNFTQNNGKFVYCESILDMKWKLEKFFEKYCKKSVFVWEQELLITIRKLDLFPLDLMIDKIGTQSEMSISFCSGLIANEGNIMLNTYQNNNRPVETFPRIEIILAHKGQIFHNLDKAVKSFSEKSDSNPFLIQLQPNAPRIRTISNKLVINSSLHESKSTRIVVLFYCEEEF